MEKDHATRRDSTRTVAAVVGVARSMTPARAMRVDRGLAFAGAVLLAAFGAQVAMGASPFSGGSATCTTSIAGGSIACKKVGCTDNCLRIATSGPVGGTRKTYYYCNCPGGSEPVCCHLVQLIDKHGDSLGIDAAGACGKAGCPPGVACIVSSSGEAACQGTSVSTG